MASSASPDSPSVSSGLLLVTKLHSERSPSSNLSQVGAADSIFPSVARKDKSWSWKSLREEFGSKDTEALFDKYQTRIQLSFFLVLLVLSIFFNCISVVILFLDKRREEFIGPIVIRFACISVFIIFTVLVCHDESWLKPKISRILASITVLVTMIFSEYGTILYTIASSLKEPFYLQRIRPAFYLILANQLFLPFPTRTYSVILSLLITSIEIILTLESRSVSDCHSPLTYRYALADLVFYLVSGVIGFLLSLLLEIANRKAFIDHRMLVQLKLKLGFEKEKEETLLNSCLPKYLIERVRGDIQAVMANRVAGSTIPTRPFNQLYMEKYKKVSILYADIVNSMLLAAKLTPCELVETLNDLFGRFDESAEANNCLRIKLLGDCYYCVSGVPEYDANHATNCVMMGLEMIDIIRSVREERFVNVDMRIGVHSGMVLSGLLGLQKWQYDIWSRDSMKASNMEHHGVPGKVHISAETMSLIPESTLESFKIRPHTYEGEDTWLVERRNKVTFISTGTLTRKKGHSEHLKRYMGNIRRRSSLESLFSRRDQFVEDLSRYKILLKTVNEEMAQAIDKLPLSKKTQWFNPEGINPICLNFTRGGLEEDPNQAKSIFYHELRFATQKDDLFRYYLYCSVIIEVAIIAIKLVIPQMMDPPKLQWAIVATILTIGFALICTFIRPGRLPYLLRVFLWLLVTAGLTLSSSIDIVTDDCLESSDRSQLSNCGYSWYYTFCFILSMTSVSLFIRISIWFKSIVHCALLVIYIVLTDDPCSILDLLGRKVSWTFIGYTPHVGHIWYISLVTILLHMIDRQVEYILRMDFQWNTKLEKEKRQAAFVTDVTKVLIENILPKHVAEKFLALKHDGSTSSELYCETYESVAVIFASIPNYIDFYTESKINEDGLKCLLLLNEIICDFDKVLASKSFSRVEKIKTIGSTYMAAVGLRPGRGSSDVSMTHFALLLGGCYGVHQVSVALDASTEGCILNSLNSQH